MVPRRPIGLVLALALTSGCIAFRAATPTHYSEDTLAADREDPETTSPAVDDRRPMTPAERAKVRRTRGIIATSVGVGELAIAGLITAAFIVTGGDLFAGSGNVTSENPAGAIGQSAKEVGGQLLATAIIAGIGITAGISGIGDTVCGVQDLWMTSSCDRTINPPRSRIPPRVTAAHEIGAFGPIRGIVR